MAVAERRAVQLGRPSGLPGRALGHVLNRANRWINRRAVERLRIARGDSVLEIGFGGGVALSLVLERTDEVAGIEVFGSAVFATGVRPPDGAPVASATERRARHDR